MVLNVTSRDLLMTVVRTDAREHATLGQLFINGEHKWFTLEDRWRPQGIKIQGETCIPAGTYQVVLDLSTRFGKIMPHVLNVPGFTGIRIHPGNTAADTAGCLLVGGGVQPDAPLVPRIVESDLAYADVLQRIRAAVAAGGRVWLDIIDPSAAELSRLESPTEGEMPPDGQIGPTTPPRKPA